MNNMDEFSKIVFKVNTSSGSGSSFYMKQHDMVITNYHVVEGHKKVALESTQREKYVANVVLVDPRYDIAFLKVQEKLDLPEVTLGDIEGLMEKDSVHIVGHPFGMPLTITEGVISCKQQALGNTDYIQTDAAVNPGNSGGPMFNQQGQIIGITTCKFHHADNVGFALPIDKLKEELERYDEQKPAGFVAICPDCSHYLSEPNEYCDRCGTELDVHSLFANVEPSPFAEFVESTIQNLGLDPVMARVGPEFWEYHQGSALVRVFCFQGHTLIMTSPLVEFPKKNIPELLKFILSEPMGPYRLGESNGQVHLSYRVNVCDLDSDHVENIRNNLVNMSKKADELDNILVEKFGCEWSREAKAEKTAS